MYILQASEQVWWTAYLKNAVFMLCLYAITTESSFFITVRKLATEQIAPLVKKMEEEHRIDDSVRQLLFDNGVSIYLPMNKNDRFATWAYKPVVP